MRHINQFKGIRTLSNIHDKFLELFDRVTNAPLVTVRNVSKYGVFSGPYFPVFGLNTYLSVFSPSAGKYGPEKTSYLDKFHAVVL